MVEAKSPSFLSHARKVAVKHSAGLVACSSFLQNTSSGWTWSYHHHRRTIITIPTTCCLRVVTELLANSFEGVHHHLSLLIPEPHAHSFEGAYHHSCLMPTRSLSSIVLALRATPAWHLVTLFLLLAVPLACVSSSRHCQMPVYLAGCSSAHLFCDFFTLLSVAKTLYYHHHIIH